ncbi:MAG TPA: hypothetical protein PLP33_24715 [Leptospiraceae bacterium]|nr:hypothetical protein [Leptospiraceae bacterium]
MDKTTVTKFFGGEDNQQFAVTACNIIGTKVWVIHAYEKSGGYNGKSHGDSFTFDGIPHVYGSVNRRRIEPEIEALPVGEERWSAVDAFRKKNREFAYSLIWGVFPSLPIDSTLRFDNGDCRVSGYGFNHVPTENPPVNGNDGWKVRGK